MQSVFAGPYLTPEVRKQFTEVSAIGLILLVSSCVSCSRPGGVQSVFAGPYLTPEVRKQFTQDYTLFNEGLLALPIGLPGFSFWKATKAVPRIIAVLGDCARQVRVSLLLPHVPCVQRVVIYLGSQGFPSGRPLRPSRGSSLCWATAPDRYASECSCPRWPVCIVLYSNCCVLYARSRMPKVSLSRSASD